MAKKAKAEKAKKDPKKPGRIKQIIQSYKMTKNGDPRIGLVLLGTFVLAGLAGFALMLLVARSLVISIVFGVLVGSLVTMIIFGRRAERAALAQIEGQPGAAAAALGLLRRGWKLDPAIAFNKQQDVVHRLVGPPGIVLIGEGNPNRLKALMAAERRKHERVVSETTITELVVGDGPDEVLLRKLVRRVRKLDRALKPAAMTDVLARLKALDANRSNIPLPKGPVPTSMKGARQNMRGR
jgi:hypothetical protein